MTRWPAVLDELMRTRRGALIGYANLYTRDMAAAEDVVQDAIIKAFSRGRAFTHINQADAYVRRTITSVYIDRARREANFRAAAPALAPPETSPSNVESGLDLDRALAALPPQLRAAVVLRYMDDLTVPQVAARMALAEGTVKRYLHDAHARLAPSFAGELPAIDDASVAEEHVAVVEHRRGGPR